MGRDVVATRGVWAVGTDAHVALGDSVVGFDDDGVAGGVRQFFSERAGVGYCGGETRRKGRVVGEL